MRFFVIIVLILLIFGLYFFTENTKSLIRTTGHAAGTAVEWGFDKIKDSKTYNDAKDAVINKTKEEISKLKR